MRRTATFIGFGEVGKALADACAQAFDTLTSDPITRDAKLADYHETGVQGCETIGEAVSRGFVVLSLVTAEAASCAAHAVASHLNPGTFYFDLNSVAPGTKREASGAIEAGGGHYIDVAVMAPVLPAAFAVPLLISGPQARDAQLLLRHLGFSDIRVVGAEVGQASVIKMTRSVMVKGIEALGAECALAAARAGVSNEVLESLDRSWTVEGWTARIDHGLDRMLVHGLRRAFEMEEVARALEDLGVDPLMTRGTIARQRALGELGLKPPAGLTAKLAVIDPALLEQAT